MGQLSVGMCLHTGRFMGPARGGVTRALLMLAGSRYRPIGASLAVWRGRLPDDLVSAGRVLRPDQPALQPGYLVIRRLRRPCRVCVGVEACSALDAGSLRAGRRGRQTIMTDAWSGGRWMGTR